VTDFTCNISALKTGILQVCLANYNYTAACHLNELGYQVWYFISKVQRGLRRSDPFKSSSGSHSLLVSDSVGTTSSCSVLAFPLSVSLTSFHLRCLCLSVYILNS